MKRYFTIILIFSAIRGDRTRGGRSSYEGCSPHSRPKLPKVQRQALSSASPIVHKLPETKASYVVQVNTLNHTEPIPQTSRSPSAYVSQLQPHTPQTLDDLLAVEALMMDDDVAGMGGSLTVDGTPSCCEGKLVDDDPDMFGSLLHLADHCLYKIVRWARNLPYFVNVPVSIYV